MATATGGMMIAVIAIVIGEVVMHGADRKIIGPADLGSGIGIGGMDRRDLGCGRRAGRGWGVVRAAWRSVASGTIRRLAVRVPVPGGFTSWWSARSGIWSGRAWWSRRSRYDGRADQSAGAKTG